MSVEIVRKRPRRLHLWIALSLFMAGLIAWFGFSFGYRLGSDKAGANLDDRSRLLLVQDRSFSMIAALEEKLAQAERNLETQKKLNTLELQASAEVQKELGLVLAEKRELTEQLHFFESIMGNPAEQAGVRIGDIALRAEPGAGIAERDWVLEVVLIQVKNHSKRVGGQLSVSISGLKQGRETQLAMAQIHPEVKNSVAVGYRYYQAVTVPIQLPKSFVAKELVVELELSQPKPMQLSEQRQWSELLP